MRTEKLLEKLKLESSTALELAELLARTGLLDKARAELFDEWLKADPDNWYEIKFKLNLLSTSELLLNRMIEHAR